MNKLSGYEKDTSDYLLFKIAFEWMAQKELTFFFYIISLLTRN